MTSPSDPNSANAGQALLAQAEDLAREPFASETFAEQERWFGENLRAAREERAISQTDLAKEMARLGFPFHQTTVSRIEAGDRPVRLAEAIALAKQVAADVTDLARPPGAARILPNLASAMESISEPLNAIEECTRRMLEARPNLRHWLAKGERLQVSSSHLKVAELWLNQEPEAAVERGRDAAGVPKPDEEARDDTAAEVRMAVKLLNEAGGVAHKVIRRLGPDAEEENAFRRLLSIAEMSGEERRVLKTVARELDRRKNEDPQQWDEWLAAWLTSGSKAVPADRRVEKLWSNLEFWETRGTVVGRRTAKNVRALANLPKAQRHAIVLHYGGELSEPKIAQILGTSERQVKTAISRGLREMGRAVAEASRSTNGTHDA